MVYGLPIRFQEGNGKAGVLYDVDEEERNISYIRMLTFHKPIGNTKG